MYLDYNVIRNAIPQEWRQPRHEQNQQYTISLCDLPSEHLNSRCIRNLILTKRYSVPCSANFWANKYPGLELTDEYWMVARNCTSEIRLITLQWKILHNIYPTSILLHKMGKKNTNKCDYCETVDYVEHFFYTCHVSKKLWQYIETKLTSSLNNIIHLTETNVMFGLAESNFSAKTHNFVNHIIVIGKLCISKFKHWQYHDLISLFKYELKLRKKEVEKFGRDIGDMI